MTRGPTYTPKATYASNALLPEQILWSHVVAQAVIDAASKDKQIKQDVIEWSQSEDFEVVCGMAGMQAAHVLSVITTVAREKRHKRAFKKAMAFRFLVRMYIDANSGEVDKKRSLAGGN